MLSFRLDSTEWDVEYAEIRNKDSAIVYQGIFRNELLFVEEKDQTGETLNKTRYKLKEVYPVYATIHVVDNPAASTKYQLIGFRKEYIKDGYFIQYKNGLEVRRTYYSKGKISKMKI